jgi:hypothetical protein
MNAIQYPLICCHFFINRIHEKRQNRFFFFDEYFQIFLNGFQNIFWLINGNKE